MKIYAIIDTYDDGVWITQEADDVSLLFSTLKLAEIHKQQIDDEEFENHLARENVRYERWSKMQAAKAILEANAFDSINEALGNNCNPFKPYEFKSRTEIVTLEVVE